MRRSALPALPALPALLATVAITVGVLTGCATGDQALSDGNAGGAASSSGSITIGSADFAESQLIASIYSQALQKAGVSVKEQFNIGSREVYIKALQDGSIDLIPEYSGALLKYLDPKSTASTSAEVEQELDTVLPKGTEALTPSAAEDKDVLAVTQATADKYSLTKVSDLQPHAAELTLGGPPEWKTRVNGVVGLKDVYGLQFKSFRSLDAGGPLTLTALKSGQVQAADMFSTDPALKAENLVSLQDDKSLFAAENVVPVIAGAKSNATVEKTLDAVSAKLTTEDLIELNGKTADGTAIPTVAKQWLADSGL